MAPEYAGSGRDDEHCGMYEEEGNVAALKNVRVAKADGKVTDSGSCLGLRKFKVVDFRTGNWKLLRLENNGIIYKHLPSHCRPSKTGALGASDFHSSALLND